MSVARVIFKLATCEYTISRAYSCFRSQVAAICALTFVLTSCGGGGSSGTDPLATTDNERDVPSLGSAIDVERNGSPSIEAISLGCDLVLDSIAIVSGDVTSFTLVVDDESPLTLSYSIVSDDEAIALASVDTDGVFSLQGVQAGSTTMPVIVSDEQGESDQVLLTIVVES